MHPAIIAMHIFTMEVQAAQWSAVSAVNMRVYLEHTGSANNKQPSSTKV